MNRLQVLLPPPGNEAFSGFGTFDFLGPENKKRLFEICDFEYMGDSDFEMGTLPKIMCHIAKSRPDYQLHKTSVRKKCFTYG